MFLAQPKKEQQHELFLNLDGKLFQRFCQWTIVMRRIVRVFDSLVSKFRNRYVCIGIYSI